MHTHTGIIHSKKTRPRTPARAFLHRLLLPALAACGLACAPRPASTPTTSNPPVPAASTSATAGAVRPHGSLPPEQIQETVRAKGFPFFRSCYEAAISTNPSLRGRLAVRFVIERDGHISQVTNGGSDLPHEGLIQCVITRFGQLVFPPPDGGIVTVVYPISFAPGELETTSLQPARLTSELIQQTVHTRFRSMRECYVFGLRADPQLRGTLTVRFVVGQDGHVTDAKKQSSELADQAVNDCVLARFRELVFPPPEGGATTIVYPIRFDP